MTNNKLILPPKITPASLKPPNLQSNFPDQMPSVIVTTGKRFIDIDGYACVIGYKEIHNQKPIAVISGPLNHSVTQTVKTWPASYQTSPPPGDYKFVIVDVSEPQEFPDFVDRKKIIEIYDHHFGFEKLWEYLGEKAKIEEIGACATLIWEEYKKKNSHPPSSTCANLLSTAILSNTLNFKSSLATARDKIAFEELKKFTQLPPDWEIIYYKDQEKFAYLNPALAITGDTKIQKIKGLKCAVAQLELWNSRNFLKEHKNTIKLIMQGFQTEHWLLISPSLSEGRDFIFTTSETLKNYLKRHLEIDFFGTDVGLTRKLFLRKEILKKIQ